MRPLTFGSLFAGVGGFDLGFERAGLVCKWQVEIDSFCQRVLAKHWPDVPKHDDVRTFPHGDPRKWKVDVICGGFPCQDLSYIGKGEGIEGDRSGLWGEYARVIRLLRPRFVVVENVPGILTRGLGRVLGDLAAGGYDAEWQSVPAAAAGADHLRFRFWLVAYAGGERLEGFEQVGATPGPARRGGREPAGVGAVPVLRELLVSDPQRARARMPLPANRGLVERPVWFANGPEASPRVLGVADGIPDRVDRIRALGNAVDVRVAEWIGRWLVTAAGRSRQGNTNQPEADQ